MGISVSILDNLDECNTVINEVQPHIIIMNTIVNDMSSLAYLAEHGKLLKEKGIRFILFSDGHNKEQISQAFAFGIDEFILKPISTKVLIPKVKKHLEYNSSSKYVFKKSDHMEVEGIIDAEIVKFSEFKIVLRAPVRIAKDLAVNITNSNIKNIKFVEFGYLASGIVIYNSDGLYDNQLYITGAKEDELKKIRRHKRVRS